MRVFTSVHILLLAYVVAALVYWGILLQQQNNRIFSQQVLTVRTKIDSASNPQAYREIVAALEQKRAMRTTQYVGEGSTFLFVILIGAAVVYSSFHRSIRLSKQQNNFMLSVTHELKSPIAAMKLNLQTLQKHQLDEDTRSKLVERCITEANRLNDLCNNILFTSQIEGRQYVSTKELFDFSDLVEECVQQYASRYPQRFEEDIADNCKLTGDRVMLQMTINNLLENAIKYTPANKPISIQLTTTKNMAQLQVRDQGAGIPDAEKKKIFNKFYRIGNEESRKAKGTGLGLYLACKIISEHKGKITVKDNKPTGSVFEICLPLS